MNRKKHKKKVELKHNRMSKNLKAGRLIIDQSMQMERETMEK